MSSVHHTGSRGGSTIKFKATSKCILCVDPSSKKFYLTDIKSGKFAAVKKVPEDIEKRIETEIQEINQLSRECNLVKFHLSEGNDNVRRVSRDVYYEYEKFTYQEYRRRRLPEYVLSLDRSDYARHASKDDISIAYLIKGVESVEKEQNQVTTEIETVVHLMNYTDLLSQTGSAGFAGEQMMQMNKMSRFQQNRGKKGVSEFKVELNLTLINSINECIKKVIREACFKYGIVIQKKDPQKIWALKMFEFDEFFYGDMPLINYYSVQKLIRDYANLEVMIVEIPKTATEHENFPPIFNYPTESSLKVFEKKIE